VGKAAKVGCMGGKTMLMPFAQVPSSGANLCHISLNKGNKQVGLCSFVHLQEVF